MLQAAGDAHTAAAAVPSKAAEKRARKKATARAAAAAAAAEPPEGAASGGTAAGAAPAVEDAAARLQSVSLANVTPAPAHHGPDSTGATHCASGAAAEVEQRQQLLPAQLESELMPPHRKQQPPAWMLCPITKVCCRHNCLRWAALRLGCSVQPQ